MNAYHDMGRAELDAAYDNAAAVAGSKVFLAGFQARSARLRARQPQYLNLSYGPGEKNRIDYFAASRPGPVLVFLHGGCWQAGTRESFSFVAQGLLAHGIHVALVGYTLAPECSVGGIVAEVRAALTWLREQAGRFGGDCASLVLAGWSAGAHLAALCLDESGVVGGLAISGVYDLEPISLCYLNEKLHLTPQEVHELSPVNRPPGAVPLVLAYGAAELPEMQRQSQSYAAARANAPGKLLELPGHNHFSILTELARPEGVLLKEVMAMLGNHESGFEARYSGRLETARLP